MPRTLEPWRPGVALAVAAMAVVVGLQAAWFVSVFEAPDPLRVALRDWIAFHRAAQDLVAGRIGDLYPATVGVGGADGASDWFFFLYPPFVALATVPLAFLPPLQAYVACAVVVATLTSAATLALSRALGFGPRACLFANAFLVVSAPWSAAVVLGHLGAGLLLPPALALAAHRRGHAFLAGAALGLMITKPNWGLPLLAMLLIGRRRTMVLGFLTATAALVLSTLPLGLQVWADWFATMGRFGAAMQDRLPAWKQVTFLSTLQWTMGKTVTDPLARGIWVSVSGSLMAAIAWAWWRLGADTERFPRLLGIGLLSILVANPYAYFYDALLAVPAALLLFGPAGERGPTGPRLLARTLFIAAFGWAWIQVFALREAGPPILGLLLTAWVVVEIQDLLRMPGTASVDSRKAGNP